MQLFSGALGEMHFVVIHSLEKQIMINHGNQGYMANLSGGFPPRNVLNVSTFLRDGSSDKTFTGEKAGT